VLEETREALARELLDYRALVWTLGVYLALWLVPEPTKALAATLTVILVGWVVFPNGARWHVPRGKSVADIPTRDEVGDRLQEAVIRAAREWGPHRLSPNEQDAIDRALRQGKYWLARLLEREARGRFVHKRVEEQFRGRLQWNHQGVDVVDLKTGRKYEILSGTESNLALHGRRMATEFFRMLTF
jgi:hypothetical protein